MCMRGLHVLEAALQLRQQLDGAVGMTLPAGAYMNMDVSHTPSMWQRQCNPRLDIWTMRYRCVKHLAVAASFCLWSCDPT
jgi:hypothetical protein